MLKERGSPMRRFRRALRSSVAMPLAYQLEARGAEIAATLERVIRGERVSNAEIVEVMASDGDDIPERIGISAGPVIVPNGRSNKATAILPVRGIALYDLEFQPWCFSTLLLAQTVTALANNPDIETILLDIDSPGGVVTGTPEAADAIFAARKTTKVVALVNPLAASAAYYLASQASEIVAVPSGDVGSIGVFTLHTDCSVMFEEIGVKPTFIFAGKFKVEGNSFEPLSDTAREHFQQEIDKLYRQFLKAVARGRGVSVSEVEGSFGRGRTVMAADAKRAGMIDRVATINMTLSRLGLQEIDQQTARRRRGEAANDHTLITHEPAREFQGGGRVDVDDINPNNHGVALNVERTVTARDEIEAVTTITINCDGDAERQDSQSDHNAKETHLRKIRRAISQIGGRAPDQDEASQRQAEKDMEVRRRRLNLLKA